MPPRHRLFVLLLAWWLPWSAAVALAATPARLVGPDLQPRPVNVQMLRQGVLTYFDNQRNLQAEPVGKFLQIRLDAAAEGAAAPAAVAISGEPVGVVELIDGQRLVGRFIVAVNEGQVLRWHHKQLGLVSVPLEQVAALSRIGPLTHAATPTIDQVELGNGDVARGFVERLDNDQVQLKPEGEGTMLTLPMSSVRTLRLANPRRAPAEGGCTVWLGDGSRLRAESVHLEDDRLTLQVPALDMPEAQPLAIAQVRRIDLATAGRRLVDLADLSWSVRSGGEVFGVAFPPQRRAAALTLQAPTTLAWELPAGARRLTALLQLDPEADTTSTARAWADCRVILRVDEQVIAEQRLWAQQPQVSINVPIRGKTLTLEVDSGVNGPVMDRVTLDQAAVLVSE